VKGSNGRHEGAGESESEADMTLHDTTFSRIASVAVGEIHVEFPLQHFCKIVISA
jgi:hypothetical protein